MISIILYSGARLRNDYSIVFDTIGSQSAFKTYLDSLEARYVSIENAYFEESGSISIEWPVFEELSDGLTYMRVMDDRIEGINSIKYYFIDSYEWRNSLVVLNYSLDVWHTYSARMNINDGVISRAKLALGDRRQTLPLQYQSNSNLVFDQLESLGDSFYLAAEYTVFKLNTEEEAVDDATLRYNYTTLISRNTWQATNPANEETRYPAPNTMSANANFLFTTSQAIETINTLTAYQGLQPLGNNKLTSQSGWLSDTLNLPYVKDRLDIYQEDLTPFFVEQEKVPATKDEADQNFKNTRYEIIQFFAIPRNLINLDKFKHQGGKRVKTSILILNSYYTVGTDYQLNFTEYQFPQLIYNGVVENSQTITLPTSKMTKGFGFKSLFIPYEWNNKDIILEVKTSFSPIGFDMSIVTQNGFLDITDQFEVPIPFTTMSATDRQLAALSRQQAKRQRALAVAATVAQGISTAGSLISGAPGIVTTARDAALDISAAAAMPKGASFGMRMRNAVGVAGYAAQGIGSIAQKITPATNQAIGLVYTGSQIISADARLNAPLDAGQANNCAPDALINAKAGFGTYRLINPINEEEVSHAIDRIGMNVFIKSNSYKHGMSFLDYSNQYEPIQFATAQVSGPFSNAIAAALENILLSGTIISYNPDIFEVI